MRIYQASLGLRTLREYHQLFPSIKLNVLRSFGMRDATDPHFRETHRDKIGSLILDSGTYSLFNRKTKSPIPITLPAYIVYLQQHGTAYDLYFNFDECFIDEYKNECFEVNYRNQCRLEKEGFKPVPVIHDLYGDEIQAYLDEGYQTVAVGSPQLEDWPSVCHLMHQFKGREVRIHLFGTFKWEYLTDFAIFSCDSTNWSLTGGYGFIYYWNEHKRGTNKQAKIYLEDYLNTGKSRRICLSTHPQRREIEEYLDRTFGYTHGDLLTYGGLYKRMLVNLHYLACLEKRINEVHHKKGFFTAE